MAARVREEEKAPEKIERQSNRETEEADKVEVEVAPGVAIGSLRRFRAALIRLTPGLPKRRRLPRPIRKHLNPERTVL